MKKIILSIAAVAALAACTKSEVQYEQPSEIGFVPVTKMNTKAAVSTTDYPDALNMYVFANAGLDGNDTGETVEVSECTEPYFRNAEFSHGSNAEHVFSGLTPYYWPNVKQLIFSGYSKSGNVANLAEAPTYDGTAITIKGYKPGDGTATLGDNDLMWFPTTGPYAKPGKIGADNDKDVNVQMKHACSWITFNVKGNEVTGRADNESTEDVDEGTTWQILDLSIADLSQSADVTLGTQAVWSNLATGTPFDVYRGTGKQLTTGYVDYTKLGSSYQDFIVIPQATKQLYIKYQYVSQKGAAADGSQDLICTEEITKPLTYTDGTDWLPGVHYIYNITIGTEEILIEPTVAEWEPKNGEGPDDNGLNSDITL